MTNSYDLIRSVALVIGIGYSARQDRKTWMWADSVLWGSYALGIFVYPQSVFPGNDNELMPYLVRCFAAVLIGLTSMWYFTRDTRDDNVVGATLWSRLMGSLVLLFVLAYSYTQNPHHLFPEKTLYFDVLAFTLLLLSTLYQFWRGMYTVGGREQKGHVSTVLRINFLIIFFTGILELTYPSWAIYFKKLTVVETIEVRCIGALFFGMSFIAWYATSFRYDEDRSAFFLAQILTCTMLFINLNLAYFVDGVFNPREALLMHLGLLPAILLLAGLYLIWRKNTGVQSTYYTRSKTQ